VQQKQFDIEALPYVDFIEFFKQKKTWKKVITNGNSPFMRLITMGDVFFKKKIIA
jgi:hypothetical protein